MSPSTPQSRTDIRRRDRAKEEDWIRDFLQRAPDGVLATAVDDQPFLSARNFVYEPERHVIYMHGARSGRTPTNIARNDRVCFASYRMGRLLPAEAAGDVSVEHAGVVIFGRISVVEDETEAREALQRLLDKYFPHLQADRDYRPITADDIKRTAVFRIDIEEWSGKQKQVEPEFPGAFHYPFST